MFYVGDRTMMNVLIGYTYNQYKIISQLYSTFSWQETSTDSTAMVFKAFNYPLAHFKSIVIAKTYKYSKQSEVEDIFVEYARILFAFPPPSHLDIVNVDEKLSW